MKILVTSPPGTGHVFPLIPLALELRTQGHDVRWATAEEACGRIERLGFRCEPAGLSGSERRRLVNQRGLGTERLPARARRQVVAPVMFGEIAAQPMLADLKRVVERFQPDVVVHDLVEFAAAPLATSRGIPHATLAYGLVLPSPLLAAVSAIVATLWTNEGVPPSESAGLYEHLYLHPIPERLGGPLPSPVARHIRPMFFDGDGPTDPTDVPEWAAAFGRERPGVYVSFGTEVAAGAPWVEIFEALAALDVDVAATTGSSVEVSTLGHIPTNVIVADFIPQSYLLQNAAVVASHGGSGTAFAVAARGIPQLCMPISADQWDNADALASVGAGVVLELDEREAPAIAMAFTRLLDDSTFASTANQLASDFADLPHPRQLVAEVVALVRR